MTQATPSQLERVKILRDIFLSQDATSLKRAFDAFGSGVVVSQENLETDFNRFFIGPSLPVAELFASTYLDDPEVIMSKSTLAIRALYETMGFTFALQNQIPEDHLGVELDAYYQLLYVEETKHIDYLRELRHYFLHEHLHLWIPLFIARIEAFDAYKSDAINYILTELKAFLVQETNTQGVRV